MLSAFDQALTAIVQQTMGFVKHHVHYASKVIKQNLDGQLELRPDSPELQGTVGVGPGPVPIRPGVPGARYKVSPGARCHLVYENGDPQKPVAIAWEEGSIPLEVFFDAVSQFRFVGSSIGTVRVGAGVTFPLALGPALASTIAALKTFATSLASATDPVVVAAAAALLASLNAITTVSTTRLEAN